MNWTEPIDIYCERTDPSFWAEPLNAISNIAFLIAALWAFRRWQRAGGEDGPALSLIVLVATIGIGSFLFHTFANRWSVMADVVPISVFIYVYFGLALRRFFGLSWPWTIVALLAFVAFSFVVEPLLRPLFGGSAGYAPALLAMLGVGLLLWRAGHPAARLILAAAGIFALSLCLRMTDQPICATLPIGTHYFWHVFNAVTLAILVAAAIRAGPRQEQVRSETLHRSE
ncbi:ceramidase [Afifella sp. H1R]|uniref:ceramidase domain-containing protein n=1 Tax=Afifella sp. H1R TaxID=2908841 RepID=UPI001F1B8B27|nr:ceramidase domain-containing protein [Afifella sp. H1R]MCF1505857.1 ceramidase [Afifella sp. H1R]